MCRRAKRKALRSSSGATASAKTAPKSHAAKTRTRRRAQTLRRRCLKNLRRRSRPSTATQSVPLPEAGPLAVGIDGGYAGWSGRNRIAHRPQRRGHPPRVGPVPARRRPGRRRAGSDHRSAHPHPRGARRQRTRRSTHYGEWVVDFIRRYGVGGSFWERAPRPGRLALRDHHHRARQRALLRRDVGGANTPPPSAPRSKRSSNSARPSRSSSPAVSTTTTRPGSTRSTSASRTSTRSSTPSPTTPTGTAMPRLTPATAGPFGRIDTLRARMAEHGAGAKPIFLTEYGESTANCGERVRQRGGTGGHIRRK